MLGIKHFLTVYFVLFAVLQANAQQQIGFTTVTSGADPSAAAAWNTSAGAPEPAATGHIVPLPGCAASTAYYYFATADHVNPAINHGGRCTSILSGFPNFSAALSANGFTIADVIFKAGVASLGGDVMGVDWFVSGDVETRYYQGGTYTLYLNNEAMIDGPMPRSTISLDYNNFYDCFDDVITGMTDFTIPQNASAGSSAAVQACAAAFLTDVANGAIRFNFGGTQPIVGTNINSNGRSGFYFENHAGLIETTNNPINCNNFAATLVSSTNSTCPNNDDGSIDINIAEPALFAWSNGATTEDVTGLTPGTYSVVVTSQANGCTDTLIVTITGTACGCSFIDTAYIDGTSCPNGDDGSISVSLLPGFSYPSLNFSWSDNPSETQSFRYNLAQGSYTVSVTDPITGCTETGTYTVNNDDDFVVNSFLPDTTTICQGDSAFMYGLYYASTWYASYDLVNPVHTDPNGFGFYYAKPGVTTTYYIYVQDLYSGCTGWDTTTIIVEYCDDKCLVEWGTYVFGVTQFGDTLVKTSTTSGYSGAISNQSLQIGEDGCVVSTVLETNTRRAFGLAVSKSSSSLSSIEYAWYLSETGILRIYESGTNVGGFGNYATGDVLVVERVGTTIRYKHNGVVKHISAVPSYTALVADAALFGVGTTLFNTRVSFECNDCPTQATAFASATNVCNGDVVTLTVVPNVLDKGHSTTWYKKSNIGGSPIIIGSDDTISVTAIGDTLCEGDTLRYYWSVYCENQLIDTGFVKVIVHTKPTGIVLLDGCVYYASSYCADDISWFDNNGNSGMYAFDASTINVPTTVTFVFRNTNAPFGCDTTHFVLIIQPCGGILDCCPILWAKTMGTTISGVTLTKTTISSFWDAGAISSSALDYSQDGAIKMTILETNTDRMFGFTYHFNYSTAISELAYAIQLKQNGAFRIFENGVDLGSFGSYNSGDVFKIERNLGNVSYYQNGTLVYTSMTYSIGVMFTKALLKTTGATIYQPERTFNCNVTCDILLNLDNVQATSCAGNDGTITVSSNQPTTTLYRWLDDPMITTETRSGLSEGTYTAIGIDFLSGCIDTLEVIVADGCELCPVIWSNLVRTQINGDTLVKNNLNNSWNAAATSSTFLPSGNNGIVRTTIVENNTERILGLGNYNPNTNINLINYAIQFLANGKVRVRESGVLKGLFGNYYSGEQYSIERVGTTIYYKRNGVTFYTSLTPSVQDLWIDVALRNSTATLYKVEQSWDCESCNLEVNVSSTDDPTCYGDNGVVILTANQPNISYLWSDNGNVNDSIRTDLGFGSFTVIATNPATLCQDTIYPYLVDDCFWLCPDVTWTNTNAVSVVGSSVTKTGANFWNGRAVSVEEIPAFTDGIVRMSVVETNTDRLMGLVQSVNAGNGYNSIDYGIRLTSVGDILVSELGVSKGNFGIVQTGDKLSIHRVGNTIYYKRNGATFYTSLISSVSALKIELSMKTPGGTIMGLETDFTCISPKIGVVNNKTNAHNNTKRFMDNEINVFPNPTTGLTTLQIQLNESNELQIDVFNSTGQRLTSEKLNNVQQLNHTIDLSNQSNGLYFIKIQSLEKTTTLKVSLLK